MLVGFAAANDDDGAPAGSSTLTVDRVRTWLPAVAVMERVRPRAPPPMVDGGASKSPDRKLLRKEPGLSPSALPPSSMTMLTRRRTSTATTPSSPPPPGVTDA